MKKIISMLLAVVMLVGIALTLVSCGAPEDGGPEINIYLGNEIYDFDPTDYYVDSNAEQVMSLLFEPLFRYTEDGELECAAAESYDIDEENRQIVIQLRESYWSNSSRVKAADFVYAWSEKLLNPNNANPAAALLYDIENAVEVKSGVLSVSELPVEATDVYELTITYREGADCEQLLRNLSSVATAPIRQADVDSAPTYWSKMINTAVSNGPFKIRRYNLATSELVLERNNGYHQSPSTVYYVGKVTPGQLVGFVTPLGETVKVSYDDIAEKTVFYMQDASVADKIAYAENAIVKDDTSVYSYVFNTKSDTFAKPAVRLALSMVIDREYIVQTIGAGKAADGFIPDVSGGSDESLISTIVDETTYNTAKDLLATAKLSSSDRRISLTVADDEKSKLIAEMVANLWEEVLSFKVNIKYVSGTKTVVKADSADSEDVEFEDSTIQKIVKDAALGIYNFDVLAVDWQTYSNDPFVGLASFTTTLSGNGKNFATGQNRVNISGWNNSEYDRLIADAYKATGEERATILKSAEALLCESMPVMPIYFNQTVSFASEDLSELAYDAFGNTIFTKVEQKDYKTYLEKEDE